MPARIGKCCWRGRLRRICSGTRTSARTRKSSTRRSSGVLGRTRRRRSSNKWCEARGRGWPSSLRSVYTRGGNTAQNAVLKGKTYEKAPSSKHQAPEKHQAPNTNLPPALGSTCVEVLWCLEFEVSLVLGAWCLVFRD